MLSPYLARADRLTESDACNAVTIKGTYPGLKSSENRWFYFSLLIWPYDVNMSIDYNCKSF